MAAPRIDTNGITASSEALSSASRPDLASATERVGARQEILPFSGCGPWFVLIPDELFDDCPLPELIDLLGPGARASGIECIRFGMPGTIEAESLVPLIGATDSTAIPGAVSYTHLTLPTN